MPAAAAAVHQELIVGGDSNVCLWTGRTLLSSHWRYAFAVSDVQAGPLQLALYGSVGRSKVALALFLSVATALLVVAAARAVGVRNPALLGGVGATGRRHRA